MPDEREPIDVDIEAIEDNVERLGKDGGPIHISLDLIGRMCAELRALREERDRLRSAIKRAGFGVCQTSGDWSIHDVSELGKAEESRTLEVINQNIELESLLRDFPPAHKPHCGAFFHPCSCGLSARLSELSAGERAGRDAGK